MSYFKYQRRLQFFPHRYRDIIISLISSSAGKKSFRVFIHKIATDSGTRVRTAVELLSDLQDASIIAINKCWTQRCRQSHRSEKVMLISFLSDIYNGVWDQQIDVGLRLINALHELKKLTRLSISQHIDIFYDDTHKTAKCANIYDHNMTNDYDHDSDSIKDPVLSNTDIIDDDNYSLDLVMMKGPDPDPADSRGLRPHSWNQRPANLSNKNNPSHGSGSGSYKTPDTHLSYQPPFSSEHGVNAADPYYYYTDDLNDLIKTKARGHPELADIIAKYDVTDVEIQYFRKCCHFFAPGKRKNLKEAFAGFIQASRAVGNKRVLMSVIVYNESFYMRNSDMLYYVQMHKFFSGGLWDFETLSKSIYPPSPNSYSSLMYKAYYQECQRFRLYTVKTDKESPVLGALERQVLKQRGVL